MEGNVTIATHVPRVDDKVEAGIQTRGNKNGKKRQLFYITCEKGST
jgi:hypothetical protein